MILSSTFQSGTKKSLLFGPHVCMLIFMITHGKKPPANERMIGLLRKAMAEILAEALEQGYYGTVGIELSVQDGTIQHVRRSLERIER